MTVKKGVDLETTHYQAARREMLVMPKMSERESRKMGYSEGTTRPLDRPSLFLWTI